MRGAKVLNRRGDHLPSGGNGCAGRPVGSLEVSDIREHLDSKHGLTGCGIDYDPPRAIKIFPSGGGLETRKLSEPDE